jgi:ssDNA-binding replication factor A large subunit
MTPEELIQQILTQSSQTSRDKIIEKLGAAREKTGGLIADTTLLRLIAREFGVEVTQETPKPEHQFPISKLVSGIHNVTITARVIAVSPVRTFEGAKPGKFASVTIMDKHGIVRAVLWNENADPIEAGALQVGQIVCFSHGYTKEDRDGKVELHLSRKSRVEINPPGAKAEDYPTSIGAFGEKIQDITDQKSINLKGTLKQVFSKSNFTRQDQTEGTVLRFKLADNTGEVTVVAWNEKAQELDSLLQPNVEVQLVNGRVKAGSNGETEVHIDSATYVEVSEAQKQLTKIANLEEILGTVNVEAEVASLPVTKEVKTANGEKINLTNFELKDNTGTIGFSAWRQHAQTASTLLMGEKIFVANVYVRKGFDGKKELSTKTATEIKRA